MKNRVEFEKALLDRVVKSLRPDFAAVVCGPEESLTFSADPGQTNRKPDPGIVERVLESGRKLSVFWNPVAAPIGGTLKRQQLTFLWQGSFLARGFLDLWTVVLQIV